MKKEAHKLAVIFPGIGYTADKPLLYFGRRIAVEYGYEIRIMDYKGFPPKVKGDRNRMEESLCGIRRCCVHRKEYWNDRGG